MSVSGVTAEFPILSVYDSTFLSKKQNNSITYGRCCNINNGEENGIRISILCNTSNSFYLGYKTWQFYYKMHKRTMQDSTKQHLAIIAKMLYNKVEESDKITDSGEICKNL